MLSSLSALVPDGISGRSSSGSRRSRQQQQQQAQTQTWLQWAGAPASYVAALVRRLPGGSWLAGSRKRRPEGGLRRRGSDLFDRPSGWPWSHTCRCSVEWVKRVAYSAEEQRHHHLLCAAAAFMCSCSMSHSSTHFHLEP